MKCPKCGGETAVRETRSTSDGYRRFRLCDACQIVIKTFEQVDSIREVKCKNNQQQQTGALLLENIWRSSRG